MRNSIRIISNILGYFINIFLIAVIMAYFFNSWDLQFNILFHYFNNYKQSIFTIMIILSYLYLYSLKLISTNNSKELVNFVVSVLMSVVSVLIFNKLLYQNTYNNIPLFSIRSEYLERYFPKTIAQIEKATIHTEPQVLEKIASKQLYDIGSMSKKGNFPDFMNTRNKGAHIA